MRVLRVDKAVVNQRMDHEGMQKSMIRFLRSAGILYALFTVKVTRLAFEGSRSNIYWWKAR